MPKVRKRHWATYVNTYCCLGRITRTTRTSELTAGHHNICWSRRRSYVIIRPVLLQYRISFSQSSLRSAFVDRKRRITRRLAEQHVSVYSGVVVFLQLLVVHNNSYVIHSARIGWDDVAGRGLPCYFYIFIAYPY